MIYRGRAVACLAAALMLSMFAPLVGAGSDDGFSGRGVGSPDADTDYMRFVHINGFVFDPLEAVPDIPDGLRFQESAASGLGYYLVQFDGPIKKAMKDDLSATGATVLDYVSYNTFVVRADKGIIDSARDLPDVRWAGLFEPAYKLSPRLAEAYDDLVDDFTSRSRGGALGAMKAAQDREMEWLLERVSGSALHAPALPQPTRQVVPLEVSVFEEWNLPLVLDAVERMGGKDITYSFKSTGLVRADMDRVSVAQLARETGVMWIDRQVPTVIHNDIARWVVQSGDAMTYATPVHDHGIDGTGQTVTLGDSGIDYEHDAFEDPSVASPGPTHRKVTDYYVPAGAWGDDTDQGSNHGTHTSGTVAGDDGTWYVYDGDAFGSSGTAGPHDGIAFNATIHVQDLSTDGYYVNPPSDYHDMYQEALDRGSWIHTNSWGSWGAEYSSEAAQTDDFVWDNQDFLVIFSAGNDGPWAGALNPEAAAKNLLAVGATYNGAAMDDVAYFSSRGPSEDGRLKPDIMAPGVDTWSALGGDPSGQTDDYIQHSGTSMAAPTVAGSCALIRQYYMDGWYPTGAAQPSNAFTPSAALIKATIINGASEMTGSGAYEMGQTWYPNDNQGWGRVNLDDALFFQGDLRGLIAFDERTGISTGETTTYMIGLGDTSMPFEISLVWSDYPGTPYSNPNLVNDLDLVVRAPDGTVYAGNQYEGYDPGESMKHASERDRLNNVECVLVISDLQVGMWTVEVTAFNTPVGPQPYALVLTGGISSETGSISMDRHRYQSDDTVTVRVADTGLDLDPDAPDTTWALIWSDTETVAENITLTETGDSSSIFQASVQLELSASPVASDGILQVQNTDVINASYYDEDDGMGGIGWAYCSATIDDDPPVITDVVVTSLRSRSCKVTWTTDEPADSELWYGNVTPPTEYVSTAPMTTNHVVSLRGLSENQTYYFAIGSTDSAGNVAYDDNGTDYYTFTTPPLTPSTPPDQEWPSYKNNMARMGVSPSDLTPPLDLLWTMRAGDYFAITSPIVSEGILITAPYNGGLTAWDAFSGEELWSRLDYGYGYVTPTAAEGMVYSCTADAYGMSAIVAFDIRTGDLVWTTGESDFYLGWAVKLAYHDGVVFGSGYLSTFALDAYDGSIIWEEYVTGAYGATVANGLVYTSDYYGTINALDEATGELVWQSSLPSNPEGAVCAASDFVYVLLGDGILVALDAITGEQAWTTSGLGYVDYGIPVCDGNVVYCESANGYVHALDAYDGAILWSVHDYGYYHDMLAYANGYLYSSSFYDFVVRNASDGSVEFTYMPESWIACPPAISDGLVWVLEEMGRIDCFVGMLPSGVMVSPMAQTGVAIPDSDARMDMTVTNLGTLGPDTFDIDIGLGDRGWDVALFEGDGVTPLEDTDGDLIVDTGPIGPRENVTICALVTVPAEATGGDSDTATLAFTSSVDDSKRRNVSVTALVPLPGTSVGPSHYESVGPGDVVTATMEVVNEGGLPDTIDLDAVSEGDWAVEVFEEDGATPLHDSDDDGVPDVGILPGLTSAHVVIQLSVPTDVQEGAFERTVVTARSSSDPEAYDCATVTVEVPSEPSVEWPTYRHDAARSGISPVDYELPLTLEWSHDDLIQYMYYSSPVVSDRTVYCSSTSGYLLALDLVTGEEIWAAGLGDSYGMMNTPCVSDGIVYVVCEADWSGDQAIVAVDQDTGDFIWSYEPISYGFAGYSSPVAALGNVYWCAYGDGLVCANDALTGDLAWSAQLPGEGFTFGPSYWGGMLFVTDLYSGLWALDAITGDTLWIRQDVQSAAAAVVAEGMLYTGDRMGGLSAIDPFDGETVWRADLGEITYVSGALSVGGTVFMSSVDVMTNYSSSMWALEASTGDVLWSSGLEGEIITASPAYSNGVVYVTSENGYIRGWDVETGDRVATYYISSSSSSSPAIANGYMVVGSNYEGVVAFSFEGTGIPVAASAKPDPLVLSIGQAGAIEAIAVDMYGNRVVGTEFEWTSMRGLGVVQETSDDGSDVVYISGVVAGTDILVFASDTVSGTVDVHILPGSAAAIEIDPGSPEVVAGGTIQFQAAVVDEMGNERDDLVTWTASESAGTISQFGTLTASTEAGTGHVTAKSGTLTATVTVTIVPGELAQVSADPPSASVIVGEFLVIEAAATDVFGNEIPDVAIEWSCTVGEVHATGDFNTSAVFVAPTEPWPSEVTAAADGFETTVSILVAAGPLERISLKPEGIAVRVGGSVDIEAVWEDKYGNEIDPESMDWECTIGDLRVADDGLSAEFRAGYSSGEGSVKASYGDVSTTASVEVTGSVLTSAGGMFALGVLAAAAAIVLILYLMKRRGKGPTPSDVPPPSPTS